MNGLKTGTTTEKDRTSYTSRTKTTIERWVRQLIEKERTIRREEDIPLNK